MTMLGSPGSQALLKLAAQYVARQLPSTWLLPLASSSSSMMSTLVQEGGPRDHSRSSPPHQPGAVATASGIASMKPSMAAVHTAAMQRVHTAQSPSMHSFPEELDGHYSDGLDAHHDFMLAPFSMQQPHELEDLPPVTTNEHDTPNALHEKWRHSVCTAFPQLQYDAEYLSFNAFKDQLMSELHAGEEAQERSAQQAFTATKMGRGATLRQSRRLQQDWSAQLASKLDAQLQQARQAAGISSANKSSDKAHAELWPLLARLGSRRVAEVAVTVFLRQVLYAARLPQEPQSQAKLRLPGVSAVSVSKAIAEALEDAVRWGRLQDALMESTTDAAGKARLRMMRRVLDVAQHTGPVTRASFLALRNARAAADALEASEGVGVEPEGIVSTARQAWWCQVSTDILRLILCVAHLPNGSPAVCEETLTLGKSRQYRPVKQLRPSEALSAFVLETDELSGRHMIDSRQMPMLVPPTPWTAMREGGLLLPLHTAVRGYKAEDYSTWLKDADNNGEFNQLYKALSVLGNTKWRIKKRVLQVVQQAMSMPEHIRVKLAVPDRTLVTLPEAPTAWGQRMLQAHEAAEYCVGGAPAAAATSVAATSSHPSWSALKRSLNLGHTGYLRCSREGFRGGQLLLSAGPLLQSERARMQAQLADAKMKNANLASIASEYDLCLSAAQQLAKSPCFWQPHFVDFRGRAYPLAGYINHQRDDVARGMLEFADGRPLGQEGLNWLYIQIANCYGHGKDKLSIAERREFGASCLTQCQATAADPWSTAGSWWQQGEDPWQLLATVFDVAAAVATGSPATYVSHAPIHQDGSCNGLQHYAALGRDRGGGQSVNLLPAAAPHDVYSAVATKVDEQVKRDAQLQVTEAVKLVKVNGGVDRKLVKQTVMTTVYGVTFIGARDQIRARLIEKGWTNEHDIFQVACYVAKLTLASVADVFSSAQIKTWLAISASCVAKTGQAVKWTSPMGFPIQQPYIRLAKDQSSWVVDARAQRTAFPPNYIHSLDAAHMMMTALACHEAGVTFAGVHDSYFTHAGTVNHMNHILRQKFVSLHARPLLEDLAAEMQRMGADNLPPIPPRGDLDLNCVLNSDYFFS